MNFNCLVTDNVRMKGIGAMSEAPQVPARFGVVSMREMLTTDWEADRHFVCYIVHGPDGEELPQTEQFRLRKSIRGQLEEHGASVKCWGFVGDWDLNANVPEEMLYAAGWDGNAKKKPKVTWTPELLDQFQAESVEVAGALCAKEIAPTYVYLTNHGARFMHFYNQDQEPTVHEEIIRGMLEEYRKLGYVLDDACVDWTRMFRAPRVVRSGRRTWEQQWFMAWSHDHWTCAALAPRIVKKHDDYADVAEYAGDRPTPEDATALLVEDPVTNKKTEAYRKLKTLLHRRGCDRLHEILLGKGFELPEGERDKTLTGLVGQLATHIYPEEWATPELMYAVLLPVAESLEPDHQTQDWLEVTWSLCRRMWTKEHSKGVDRKEKEQKAEVRRLTEVGEMLENVRKLYPKVAALHDVDAIAFEELSRMGLVKVGTSIYVMRPDGYYDANPTSGAVLPGTINDLGSDILMQTQIVGKRGGIINLDAKELLMRHGRELQAVVGQVGQPGTFIEDDRLIVPLPGVRDDLPPLPADEFDEIQDYFSHAISSAEKREHLLDSLAAFPQEQERTAAISIVGPGAAGKDMIGAAISNLWSRGAAVVDSIVGTFQEDLVGTGFVWVNETHGLRRSERAKFAGKFRQLVGGQHHVVARKFQPNIEIRRCYRVLFTANDNSLLESLLGDDSDVGFAAGLDATSQRIARFDFDKNAASWLRARGGMSYTDRTGAEWVSGDPNRGGMRLTRFVLDLARMAQDGRRPIANVDPNGRFLVRGTDLSTEGRDLVVGRGLTPHVLEALAHAARPHSPGGVYLERELVLVSSTRLADFMNQTQRPHRERITPKRVAMCLKPYVAFENEVRRDGGRVLPLDRSRLVTDLEHLELELPPGLHQVREDGAA